MELPPNNTKSSWIDKEDVALYVLRRLMKKATHSQSTTITRQGKSVAFFVPTAIGTKSDGTGTRTYFEGWLNT